MSDISVQHLSSVVLPAGMGVNLHTHDYWHFSLQLSGLLKSPVTGDYLYPPYCTCHLPRRANPAFCRVEKGRVLNVMFHVAEGPLKRRLEVFPFHELEAKHLHIPVLTGIFSQVYELSPSQEFIDSAFTYYLHLLIETAPRTRGFQLATTPLADKALDFIERNYRDPILLEDVANHIGRTRTYTSYLISTTTGKTFIEHLNSVRVQKACALLAYSNIPLEQVYEESGFTSLKNFGRVFKARVGVTPRAYRTSHLKSIMCYTEDCLELNTPYTEPKQAFTYVCAARKRVDWRTPLEYATQVITPVSG